LFGGNAGGGNLSAAVFSVAVAPLTPTTVTQAASGTTYSTSTLNGTVNPNGDTATGYFRWGTDPTLTVGTDTTAQALGNGTSAVAINQSLTGLTPQTTYYFRAVGTN